MITQNKLALNTPISGGLNAKWVAACSLRFAAIVLFMAMFDNSYAQASFPPVTINLNYPQYQRLRLDGGYQYVDDVGMRGVIIYRLDESTYIAYEQSLS